MGVADPCSQEKPQAAPRPSHLLRSSADLIVEILGLLEPTDTIHVALTCKLMSSVCLSPYPWRRLCQQRWGLPDPKQAFGNQLPDISFLQLFPLIEAMPQGFDCAMLKVLAGSQAVGDLFSTDDAAERAVAMGLEYKGGVGTGNRCIRTNLPLPSTANSDRRSLVAQTRNNELLACPLSIVRWLVKMYNDGSSAAQLPCGRARSRSCDIPTSTAAATQDRVCPPIPLCYPVAVAGGGVDVTARLVGYFEVSIGQPKSTERGNVPECVAVGVSLEDFSLRGRMPGWDNRSYGYHGDDGGAFHNGGSMLFKYGPSFGPGDVVGCGLDYSGGEGAADLFFTLNGALIGTAFQGLKGAYYPTVGIDSSCPVRINVGAEPFKFDLNRYAVDKGHPAIIRASLAAHPARSTNANGQEEDQTRDTRAVSWPAPFRTFIGARAQRIGAAALSH